MGLLTAVVVFAALWFAAASFQVLPLDEIQPDMTRAAGSAGPRLELLRRVSGRVPGEARYWYLLAVELRRRARLGWFDESAPRLLDQAEEAAVRAAGIVATDPYFHELLGGIRLDRVRHPGVNAPLAPALKSLHRALRDAPGSPPLYQQVGLELVAGWAVLDEEGRQLLVDVLRQTVEWLPGLLDSILDSVSVGLPLENGALLMEEVTPAEPATLRRLSATLHRLSARIPPGATGARTHLAAVSLRTGERLLTAEDLSVETTMSWVRSYVRAFPEATPDLHGLLERLRVDNPGRAAPVLASATIEAASERRPMLEAAVALARERTSDLPSTLSQAAELIAQLDTSAAIAWYREAADLRPGDPAPLLEAAELQIARREFGAALVTAQEAISRAPGDLAARRMLGDVQAELLMFRDAAESWQFVAQRAPRDANIRLRLARLMEQQGRLAEARRYYESAASIQPSLRAELQRFLDRSEQQ